MNIKKITIVATSILSVGAASFVNAETYQPTFYTQTAQLKAEGKLGQILKQEEIKTTLKNAKAYRIAYVSSDVQDKKTISTGLMVVPTTKAPAGGRGIVSWSHGTTGTAQNCGPSQVENPAVELNEYFLMNGNSWTDYGIPLVQEFIDKGRVVVATDYQGLGGGGNHQYAVARTNARDAINIIRAAGSLKSNETNKKAVIYGWSQGGGSTLAVVNQPEYLNQKGTAYDGIELIGAVGLAPDELAAFAPQGEITDEVGSKFMAAWTKEFSDNSFNFAHMTMNYWGTQVAYPEKLKLTDVFTEDGAKAINQLMQNKCMHALSDTFNFNYGSTYKTLLNPNPTNAKAWTKAMIDGSIKPVKVDTPVMIYWGAADTVVPPKMGEIYQKQMCALGSNVTRMKLSGEQTHFSTPPAAEENYKNWINDRFDGKPVEHYCANLDQ